MRKKILSMSIAAVMTAITSSSVMAFDTTGTFSSSIDGLILVQDKAELAAYEGNILPGFVTHSKHVPVPSIGDLRIAANGRGDALIFPLFNQSDDWGTEIVVRNTDQYHAIVAKVAVYASDDSREVLDFNVYLSASDVVRFKIENGNLTSEDGSVLRDFPAPSSNIDDVDEGDFASAAKPFTRTLGIDSGYVVVYGMAQASTDADPVDSHSQRYHKQHSRLFSNYRREMDVCRPGWRIGHLNAMDTGTYIRRTTNSSVENYSVAAPNQAINCNLVGDVEAVTAAVNAIAAADIATIIAGAIDGTDANTIIAAADAADAAADAAFVAANAAMIVAGTAPNDATAAAAAVLAETSATAAKTAAAAARLAANTFISAAFLNKLVLGTVVATVATANATNKVVAAVRSTDAIPGNFFGDVAPSLTGTVRLYNATSSARDMILPAKAIANFTSGNKIIYAEGEIAALQDRRIQGTNDATPAVDIRWAKYNEAGIRADARAFFVRNTTYTFSKESVANQLIITQPYKRPLVQLGNNDGYWQDITTNYGGFSFIYNVFNEHEEMDNTAYTHSPHNSGISIFRDELEAMFNLEDETDFEGENGYALVRFTNVGGQNSGIPAVISQMIGTTVGGVPQLNWIYSQTN
jgi:hypothetical protein